MLCILLYCVVGNAEWADHLCGKCVGDEHSNKQKFRGL